MRLSADDLLQCFEWAEDEEDEEESEVIRVQGFLRQILVRRALFEVGCSFERLSALRCPSQILAMFRPSQISPHILPHESAVCPPVPASCVTGCSSWCMGEKRDGVHVCLMPR